MFFFSSETSSFSWLLTNCLLQSLHIHLGFLLWIEPFLHNFDEPHLGQTSIFTMSFIIFMLSNIKLLLLGNYPIKDLPTFREIRSLGAKLYEEQGVPKPIIQSLLGHSDISMTNLYLDRYEVKWQEVN